MGIQHVFIIGSKGIPAKYGGFETFVDQLTTHQKTPQIQYHIACLSNGGEEQREKVRISKYHGAECFEIKAHKIGSAKAVLYDLDAFEYCIEFIKVNKIEHPIIYILACRIGPFIWYCKKKLEKYGGVLYINPDGHEWKRAKWNAFVKKYWKLSERLMVKHADLLLCDSRNIEVYIKNQYRKYHPNTIYIAYGVEVNTFQSHQNDADMTDWLAKHQVEPENYYLIVGRFVPENNYEQMIREFMKTDTSKELVIVTNHQGEPFYQKLSLATNFENDKRIKFVGTVYNRNLLRQIRENAYGYLHGHEVGGTNPSLLEALESTDLNLLLDVGFNREVGGDSAIYWDKTNGNL